MKKQKLGSIGYIQSVYNDTIWIGYVCPDLKNNKKIISIVIGDTMENVICKMKIELKKVIDRYTEILNDT